jgi:hypothetical protein
MTPEVRMPIQAMLLPILLLGAPAERPPIAGAPATPTNVSAALAATPPVADQDTVRRRRRPSMVGYTGDATIGTQLRVRWDAGYGIEAPDRAEFFYAKCGCYRDLPAADPSHDPHAPGPGPGIATALDYQQLGLLLEYSPRSRFSVYAELPVRWLRPQAFSTAAEFGDQRGISDIRGGAKFALVDSPDEILTVQVQGAAPTGAASRGLGTNLWRLEPSLLWHRTLSPQVTVEAQFGASMPFQGSAGVPVETSRRFAGNVLLYGFGPSVVAYRSGDLAVVPVVEVVGWHVLDGLQTAPGQQGSAGGINIVNLKAGARILYGNLGSIYMGYGRAVTSRVWYDDIIRVEFRYGL